MTALGNGGKNLAVCDRCRRNLPRELLRSDPNSPGLKVCAGCRDQYNPYRLPPRQPDPIALPWVRPQVHLVSPIYQIQETVPIAPVQDPLNPVLVETSPDTAVKATGNLPAPLTEFELPNIEYAYDFAPQEEYESPRERRRRRNEDK